MIHFSSLCICCFRYNPVIVAEKTIPIEIKSPPNSLQNDADGVTNKRMRMYHRSRDYLFVFLFQFFQR